MARCVLCRAAGSCRHKVTDAAVLAHRADPSDENRERVLAAMRASQDVFLMEQTIDYQVRTHRGLTQETP